MDITATLCIKWLMYLIKGALICGEGRQTKKLSILQMLSYTVASRAFVCQMPTVKGAPLISPEKKRGENLSKTSEL